MPAWTLGGLSSKSRIAFGELSAASMVVDELKDSGFNPPDDPARSTIESSNPIPSDMSVRSAEKPGKASKKVSHPSRKRRRPAAPGTTSPSATDSHTLGHATPSDQHSAAHAVEADVVRAIREQILLDEEHERTKRQLEDERMAEEIRLGQERSKRIARSTIPRKSEATLAETLFPIEEVDERLVPDSRCSTPLSELSSVGSAIDVVLEERVRDASIDHDLTASARQDLIVETVQLTADAHAEPVVAETADTTRSPPASSTSGVQEPAKTRPDPGAIHTSDPNGTSEFGRQNDLFHFDSDPAPEPETSTASEIREQISHRSPSSPALALRSTFHASCGVSSSILDRHHRSEAPSSGSRESTSPSRARAEDYFAPRLINADDSESTQPAARCTALADSHHPALSRDYARTDTSSLQATEAIQSAVEDNDDDVDDEADLAWLEESEGVMILPKPLESRSISGSSSASSHISVEYPTPAPSDGSDHGMKEAKHPSPRMPVKSELVLGSSTGCPPIPFMRTPFGLPLSVSVCGDKAPLVKYRLLIEVSTTRLAAVQIAHCRC